MKTENELPALPPTPWTWDSSFGFIRDGNGDSFAYAFEPAGPLLAAAPALREALEAAVKLLQSRPLIRVCQVAAVHGLGLEPAEATHLDDVVREARAVLVACRGATT